MHKVLARAKAMNTYQNTLKRVIKERRVDIRLERPYDIKKIGPVHKWIDDDVGFVNFVIDTEKRGPNRVQPEYIPVQKPYFKPVRETIVESIKQLKGREKRVKKTHHNNATIR